MPNSFSLFLSPLNFYELMLALKKIVNPSRCLVSMWNCRSLFFPCIARLNKITCDSYFKSYVADGLMQRFLDQKSKHVKNVTPNETLELTSQANEFGAKPKKVVLCNALSSCAKTQNWKLGINIHAYLIRSGYEDNLFLSSALVDFYAKCNAIGDAKKVFSGMKSHDQVSWTSLIAGFSLNGKGRDALLLFKEMLNAQVKPNCFTYTSVISSCVEQKEAPKQCSTLHAHVIRQGFDTSNYVISSLIDCYANWGQLRDAVLLFSETSEKDTIVYASMISGYSQNRYNKDALELFSEMSKNNLTPSDHILSSILNACGSLTVLLQGRQLHSLIIKMGSESNVFVASALIEMYSKCGNIDEARRVLDQTSEKNTVLWTSLIMGYAQCGRSSDALVLFDSLLTEKGFFPDHVCFIAVLTACNHAGLLDKGVEYFNQMRTKYGLSPILDHYACLIDLYARNGNLRKARALVEEMPYEPNQVIWSSIMNSCKIHGEVELGREAADQLIKMEPSNAIPYITLAHIYARNGLWTEASEIRSLMKQRRLREHAGRSWI